MTSKDIRDKYIKFFTDKGHKEIAPAKLVPENDPSTLFTSSGMQPLVPYLLGQVHPAGKRLVNSQPCFRAEDIEEVGDNRHTTFFEMLGNWSLGDYFKKEQLAWVWEFLTKELELPKEKLYVSVFEGNEDVPKDVESYELWKSLGLPEDHIYFYGVDKNWWSRLGSPNKMPVGEIGGPDSEVFYEFTQVEHDAKYGEKCHPNCNCGRFLEIGNSVFIQYLKRSDGKLKELTENNVDFGGGLERLTAATENKSDIFEIDLFWPIIKGIEDNIFAKFKYLSSDQQIQSSFRILADHIRAVTFLVASGVVPSNKTQGYILRRLIRRSVVQKYKWGDQKSSISVLLPIVVSVYGSKYPEIKNALSSVNLVEQEENKFMNTYTTACNKWHALMKSKASWPKFGESLVGEGPKYTPFTPEEVFDFITTYGLPLDIIRDELHWSGDYGAVEKLLNEHREKSKTASAGMFKGGLADHSEVVTKYHTATHLLHQALRDVLGSEVFQKGSNITSERLRFDFSFDRKLTDEEMKQVEDLVNKKIEEDLKVDRKIVTQDEAKKMNAIGLFNEKYGSEVSIYGIGPNYSLDSAAKDQRVRAGYYSLEICGGPHIETTAVIGKIKITKEEAVSAGIRRVRAQIVA
ncbi:MAG: alanine--tRNA ligase [Candidatus Daviesbacteria bacterium]|nr:alanine--tRNA ligase [Candidatus Daviesbacteria bacterium]